MLSPASLKQLSKDEEKQRDAVLAHIKATVCEQYEADPAAESFAIDRVEMFQAAGGDDVTVISAKVRNAILTDVTDNGWKAELSDEALTLTMKRGGRPKGSKNGKKIAEAAAADAADES